MTILVSSLTNISSSSSRQIGTRFQQGLLKYFPDALFEVARLSKTANDKHNPGEPLHWSKDKSADHADCIVRHLADIASGLEFDELCWVVPEAAKPMSFELHVMSYQIVGTLNRHPEFLALQNVSVEVLNLPADPVNGNSPIVSVNNC